MSRSVALLKFAEGQGGLEKTANQIAKAFAEAGCSTHWIQGKGRGFIPLLRFDALAKRAVQEHDIVFGFDRTTHQTHLRAGNGCHRAWLSLRQAHPFKRLSFACNPLHQTILHLEKKAFESRELRLLITNSHLVKRQIQEAYSVRAPIEVVPNGVDWESYENVYQTFEPRQELTLLFAGHGYERKGLSLLLQALRQVPARLLVVGKERNRARFQEEAKGLRVEFLGERPTIVPYLQQADALVIPSLYDPFANVTVEALAMGVFVLTSPYNGGAEVLTPQTGLVFNGVEELVEALRQVPAKTAALAKQIRNSVRHLQNPGPKIVSLCLTTASSPAHH